MVARENVVQTKRLSFRLDRSNSERVSCSEFFYLHNTFYGTQAASDAAIEALSSLLNVPRRSLNFVAGHGGLPPTVILDEFRISTHRRASRWRDYLHLSRQLTNSTQLWFDNHDH